MFNGLGGYPQIVVTRQGRAAALPDAKPTQIQPSKSCPWVTHHIAKALFTLLEPRTGMLRGQDGKRQPGQCLSGCHGLLRAHDLRNHGVVALDGYGLAPGGNAVQYLAGISGELCRSNGLHCQSFWKYALIRILRKNRKPWNFRRIFTGVGTRLCKAHYNATGRHNGRGRPVQVGRPA